MIGIGSGGNEEGHVDGNVGWQIALVGSNFGAGHHVGHDPRSVTLRRPDVGAVGLEWVNIVGGVGQQLVHRR